MTQEEVDTCREYNVSPKNTLFLGNDINDIPAFKCVGIPVAVADAFDEVIPFVKYKTINNGGNGAVREICDMVFKQKTNQS